MTDITESRESLEKRILYGNGKASPSDRRAAFDNGGLTGPAGALTDNVVRHAYRVTDDDIKSARMSGFSEDQLFEIVVCAAVGQATRQYNSALAALEVATGKE